MSLPFRPDTGSSSSSTISDSRHCHQKQKQLFSFSKSWLSSRRRLYFQPICRLCNLDFVFLLMAQSGLKSELRLRYSATPGSATADCFSEKVYANTSKSWLGAAPSHYIAETGSVPVPDSFKLAAFSEGGGDVSADVLVFHQLCACLSVLP